MTISQYMRVHRCNPAFANWDIISIAPDFVQMKNSKQKTDIEKSIYQELNARGACYSLRLDFMSRKSFNEVVDQSITLKKARITAAYEYSYDSDIRLTLYISNKDFIKTSLALKRNKTAKERRLK